MLLREAQRICTAVDSCKKMAVKKVRNRASLNHLKNGKTNRLGIWPKLRAVSKPSLLNAALISLLDRQSQKNTFRKLKRIKLSHLKTLEISCLSMLLLALAWLVWSLLIHLYLKHHPNSKPWSSASLFSSQSAMRSICRESSMHKVKWLKIPAF